MNVAHLLTEAAKGRPLMTIIQGQGPSLFYTSF